MLSCPILTYHSQNVFANRYGANDHISLAIDLELLHQLGKRVISLSTLLDWLSSTQQANDIADAVCLTFDDGCNYDAFDLEFPPYGLQTSFLSILRAFRDTHFPAQPERLHATSFVIACESTRQQLDCDSLFARNHLTDSWWEELKVEGLIDIQSHGWDHMHAAMQEPTHSLVENHFSVVDSAEQCAQQIILANDYITSRCGGIAPEYFAYPFGVANPYVYEHYLPEHIEQTGIRAAFSTDPVHVNKESNRWNLPRYVCGRDWKTPAQFEAVLSGSFAHSVAG